MKTIMTMLARPMGRNSDKKARTFEQRTYDDEVPSKEVSLELLARMSRNGMNWIPTIGDQNHMQDALNDMMRTRFDGEYNHFLESDYKYLYKNDIDDINAIWERVYDYQLGLEGYQLKANLTAPKLILPGIEETKSYTITSLPFIGLIYKNSKKEKRIMDIDEIPKLYPALSKYDAKFMMFSEKYIQEHLRHQDQMRRWESYMNGRPLQQRWEGPRIFIP
ncbi:hypothetical protein Tco_0792608 [Tanacetum coccineum]